MLSHNFIMLLQIVFIGQMSLNNCVSDSKMLKKVRTVEKKISKFNIENKVKLGYYIIQ